MTTLVSSMVIASVRQRHQKMALENIDDAVSPQDRQQLIEDIIAAGAETPPGPARDNLRNMLYFWTGDQIRRGERRLDAELPTLADFTDSPQSNAPALAPAPGTQGGAESTVAPAGLSPAPAAPPESTRGVSGTIDALRNLARRATGTGSGAPEDAPAVPATDIEKEARARAILRISALARQWRGTRDAEGRRGYLLTGRALAEASLYADDDPDIQALVSASQSEADAVRRRSWVRRGIVAAIPVFCLGLLLWQYFSYIRGENTELLNSNTLHLIERQAIRSEARTAVDALAHGDLQPLKSLLQRLANASPAELSGLQITSSVSASATEATSAQTPRADANTRATAQAHAPSAATCSGYLWFGSESDSRLSDKRNPVTLKTGDTVTLDNRADLRLRSDWPALETYGMSSQNGLVPAGSTVKITGAPRTYPRKENQIWAPVTVARAFCTSVFLQYAGSADKRDAVLGVLHNISVQTPPAEQVATAKGLAEVRYFWLEDKAVADQVAEKLGSFAPDGKLKVVPLTDFQSKPSPGTIEVWLDLSR